MSIKDARVELGISQAELAARAGISQPYMSHIETGRIVPPQLLARRLERVLGLRPGALPSRSLSPREAESLDEGAPVWSDDGRPGRYITTVRGQVVCLYA